MVLTAPPRLLQEHTNHIAAQLSSTRPRANTQPAIKSLRVSQLPFGASGNPTAGNKVRGIAVRQEEPAHRQSGRMSE